MFNVEQIPCLLASRVSILALGADTRQRVSWTPRVHGARAQKIYSLSPKNDFTDLKEFYFQAARFVKREFRLSPDTITFDPHPNFVCQKEAEAIRGAYFSKARLLPVFHHIAHAANFGIEVGKNRFIALTFDGTGYGEDGNVWGGEFFIYRPFNFKRAAHFQYLALPGNEKAISQPWRVAFASLYKIYGAKIMKMSFGFLKNIDKKDSLLVAKMIEKNFNTPYASSCGRLFDAVSALLGIRLTVKKEAEAAIALQAAASQCNVRVAPYAFDIKNTQKNQVVDFSEMFKEIVTSNNTEKTRSVAARRFHATVAASSGRVCRLLRKKFSTKTVYCSGGVFMNDILRTYIQEDLSQDGFEVFFAKKPFITDLGISQGQIAACCMGKD